MEEIGVRLLREGARPPCRASAGASGFDLYACLPDGPVTVGNAPVLVPTGIALAVPPGLDAQVRPRSGLASRGLLATFGTLDADYRGELFVTLHAVPPGARHVVRHGDRVAQLVVARLAAVEFAVHETLPPTARGAGGHGSTGR